VGIEEVVKTVEYRVKGKLNLAQLNEVVNDAIVKGVVPRHAGVRVGGAIDTIITFHWIDFGNAKDYSIKYKKSKYGSYVETYAQYDDLRKAFEDKKKKYGQE
jgi:hypothetical protein